MHPAKASTAYRDMLFLLRLWSRGIVVRKGGHILTLMSQSPEQEWQVLTPETIPQPWHFLTNHWWSEYCFGLLAWMDQQRLRQKQSLAQGRVLLVTKLRLEPQALSV